jgi:hypothetical protein
MLQKYILTRDLIPRDIFQHHILPYTYCTCCHNLANDHATRPKDTTHSPSSQSIIDHRNILRVYITRRTYPNPCRACRLPFVVPGPQDVILQLAGQYLTVVNICTCGLNIQNPTLRSLAHVHNPCHRCSLPRQACSIKDVYIVFTKEFTWKTAVITTKPQALMPYYYLC